MLDNDLHTYITNKQHAQLVKEETADDLVSKQTELGKVADTLTWPIFEGRAPLPGAVISSFVVTKTSMQ